MADISYTRTTWADGQEGGTAIDATKLNNIEQGIVDAVAAIGPNDTTEDGTLKAQIDENTSAISDLQDSVVHGKESMGIISPGSYADKSITFDTPMKDVPNITAMRTYSGATGYNMQLGTSSVTKNGFILRCWNFGSNNIDPQVSWIAIA